MVALKRLFTYFFSLSSRTIHSFIEPIFIGRPECAQHCPGPRGQSAGRAGDAPAGCSFHANRESQRVSDTCNVSGADKCNDRETRSRMKDSGDSGEGITSHGVHREVSDEVSRDLVE